MPEDIIYRAATTDDIGPAYAVYRRSLFDYLFRLGMVDEATAKDPPIEESWKRQSTFIEHLWRSAAENWIAVQQFSKRWPRLIVECRKIAASTFGLECMLVMSSGRVRIGMAMR